MHCLLSARFAVIGLGLLILTGCPPSISHEEPPKERSSTDSYPFTFNLLSVDGQPVEKKDFAGQVLIVDIWGTWCPPCRKEVPHFIELQEELGPQGLQIVGINFEQLPSDNEAIDTINAFTEQIPINYPLLLGTQEILAQVPDMQGYPTTIFIDRKGNVRRTAVGYHSKEELLAYVEPLLAEAE